ncbi:hypothetical protein ACH5RR_035339 [Cinchona calisaya]|uniref:Glycosyltransferase family 92 protein n=1 Tax=Cinchona calisaya TaxID=153742 RepID=A0ABD2YDJ7_9GENT
MDSCEEGSDCHIDDSGDHLRLPPPPPLTTPPPSPALPNITTTTITSTHILINHAINENLTYNPKIPPQVSPLDVTTPSSFSTVSILLPDWEVLVIVSPKDTSTILTTISSVNPTTNGNDDDEYICLFPNNDFSPAKTAGILPFSERATFKCVLPNRIRWRLPFPKPLLTKKNSTPNTSDQPAPAPEMFRWTYVVYDSLTTDDDVVVFAKGPNNRQGIDREPSEFNCVFYIGDDVANGVRTTVTNSMQEVFRCQRPPKLTAFHSTSSGGVKVSLVETVQQDTQPPVPTVAYYTPPRKLVGNNGKALLCACTMVYNVAKFLKEWVIYHSKIGVEKFILYDNGSDDNLENVVKKLVVEEGYDINTYFWYWLKTQEAGFSHSAVYAKDSCTWTAYIDVDDFIYSPSWFNSPMPSKSMLHSMLLSQVDHHEDRKSTKKLSKITKNKKNIHLLYEQQQQPLLLELGQVNIECREFGPSNQTEHPAEGVMQGYNCRKRYENRHKSIVLLEAIDNSLLNAIHHFNLKPGYRVRKVSIRETVVNHYKFQAWPEFKAKFRRWVSAYVVDWTQQVNAHSNDRTPGLGFSPVEPQGWPNKFCEVHDNGLKDFTRKWFAGDDIQSPSGYKMAWQR